MKILYVTTIGLTMGFFNCFIKRLIDEGNTIDIATNEMETKVPDCYREWNCAVHQIDTSRSPFNKGNINAVKQIRQLVQKENYDIVHCHTPVAAMCTRLACKDLRKQGTKVIYTAHGFHFFKGAPFINWLLYYPVEWFLAHYTDVLITINREDYARAQKFAAKKVCYVPGVGIDTKKFAISDEVRQENRKAIREELGIPVDAMVLLSVGEVNENKNHRIVIDALAKCERKDVHYIICGQGPLQPDHIELAKQLRIGGRVHLVGYRNDVVRYYQAADVFIFPSIREGLGLAALEAMCSGLPIIASENRGTIEYIEDNKSGRLCKANDLEQFSDVIQELVNDEELRQRLALEGLLATKRFTLDNVIQHMQDIYSGIEM